MGRTATVSPMETRPDAPFGPVLTAVVTPFGAEVDRRVQATFSVPFRRSDIVARWYSGDEIVILFDSERIGAVRKMEELAVAAAAEGLTFKFDLGDWDVGKEPVEDVIEQLSRNVMLQKTEEATPVDRS